MAEKNLLPTCQFSHFTKRLVLLFSTTTPGAVFTTLYFFVTYKWAKYAIVFVAGGPFQWPIL
jgi:hypothetical protein